MFSNRKVYNYIGEENIEKIEQQSTSVACIKNPKDVFEWIHSTRQDEDSNENYNATFIIDRHGKLCISDHLIDHVYISKGEPVLCAGDIAFKCANEEIEVSEITNHSTGFCPEPESWKYVKKALKKAKLIYPENFTTEYIYRICDKCNSINVVKDEWFVCAVCDSDLNKKWNVG